ncbi:MAG TPA: hypothetical protein VHE81_09530, partial [Lacipirellulaceae bacterium]|nr:hypothetical protein [Lacipirellulaceae bacterium]
MAGNRGNAENTATHTAVDGSVHKSAFPPFDHSTFASQLVWLAITFAFLYVTISRIALPRVRSLIDARQNTIEGDLAQAMQLKEESNAALSAYEGELASARARAGHRAEAREKVNQAAVEARESLDDNLATRLAEAESRIAARNNGSPSIQLACARARRCINGDRLLLSGVNLFAGTLPATTRQ